jgi:hypothetical protein
MLYIGPVRPKQRLLARDTGLEQLFDNDNKPEDVNDPEHRAVKKSRVNSKGGSGDIFSTLGLQIGAAESKHTVAQPGNSKSFLSKLRSGTMSRASPSANNSSSSSSKDVVSASASTASDEPNDSGYFVNRELFAGMRFFVQAVPDIYMGKLIHAITEKGGTVVHERETGVWTIMPFAKYVFSFSFLPF